MDSLPVTEEGEGEDEVVVADAKDEVMLFFIRLSESVGLPRSLGQIYGLLFCSPEPLPFDEIVERASVSKGSVSQGLRTLESMKAVKAVIHLNDRRTFYEAETSVRKLLSAILEDKINPILQGNTDNLDQISDRIRDLDSGDARLIYQRLQSLRVWHSKAKRLLPWLVRLSSLTDEDKS